jgi:hypothetical protein
LKTAKAFQVKLRSDNSDLQVNDSTEAKYPEPTRAVANGIYYLAKACVVRADRTIIRRPIPVGEPNTVEGLQIARYEPEETV